ncbi:MAG TPA: hypothetical protein VF175_13730 [Lacipirellula sp.]
MITAPLHRRPLTLPLIVFVCLAGTIVRSESTTTLVYEVDQASLNQPVEKVGVNVKDLVEAVNRRLGPAGSATLLPNGQIQIDLKGPLDGAELESAKMRAAATGSLEFRILASPLFASDMPIIRQAQSLAPKEKEVVVGEDVEARWVRYSTDTLGSTEDSMVTRAIGGNKETLILIDPLHVTGVYLRAARKTLDQRGTSAIELFLTKRGAKLLGKLTGGNAPNPAGSTRRLGLVLDDKLLAAPTIQATVSNAAVFGGLSKHEATSVMAILNEGVLPLPLREVEETQ